MGKRPRDKRGPGGVKVDASSHRRRGQDKSSGAVPQAALWASGGAVLLVVVVAVLFLVFGPESALFRWSSVNSEEDTPSAIEAYLRREAEMSSLERGQDGSGELMVLTYMNLVRAESKQGFCRSVGSALAMDLPLEVLGFGERWHGSVQKLEAVHERLAHVKPRTVVAFADGVDTIFVGHRSALLDGFQYYRDKGYRLVFGAECNCWPFLLFDNSTCADFKKQFPGKQGHASYLNSGFWIGEAGFVRELIDEAVEMVSTHETGPWTSDQVRLAYLLARKEAAGLRKLVALDYDNRLVINFAPTSFAVQTRQGTSSLFPLPVATDHPLSCAPSMSVAFGQCRTFHGRDRTTCGGTVVDIRSHQHPSVLHFNLQNDGWRKVLPHLPWNRFSTSEQQRAMFRRTLESKVFTYGGIRRKYGSICSASELAAQAASKLLAARLETQSPDVAIAVLRKELGGPSAPQGLYNFAMYLREHPMSAEAIKEGVHRVGAIPCDTSASCFTLAQEQAVGLARDHCMSSIRLGSVEHGSGNATTVRVVDADIADRYADDTSTAEAGLCSIRLVTTWLPEGDVEIASVVGSPIVVADSDRGFVAPPVGEEYGFEQPHVLDSVADLFFWEFTSDPAFKSARFRERHVFVAVFTKCLVDGATTLVYTQPSEGTSQTKVFIPSTASLTNLHGIVHMARSPTPSRKLVRAGLAAQQGCDSYAGFLFGCLTRALYVVMALGDKAMHTPMLVPVDPSTGTIPRFAKEALQLVGVPSPMLRSLTTTDTLIVDELTTADWEPTDTRPDLELLPPQHALRRLRRVLRRSTSEVAQFEPLHNGNIAVFVRLADSVGSVSDASEDALLAALETSAARRGNLQVVEYTVGSMDLAATVELFAMAAVVVGLYGDGLSNAVFCAPGAALLEVSRPEPAFRQYMHLAAAIDLEYYAATASVTANSHGATTSLTKIESIVQLFEAAVDKVLGGSGDYVAGSISS